MAHPFPQLTAPSASTRSSPTSGQSVPSGLLDQDATEEFVTGVTAARDLLAARLRSVDRPFTGARPADLRGQVDAVDLDHPMRDPEAALAEIGALYLDDAVWFHHPRYVAHLNCPVALASVTADLIASTVNSSLDTWDQSAGATLMERRLVEWTAGRLGLGPTADGVFTSGGSQSNLQALLMARGQAVGGGPLSETLPRLRVLVSEVGHFSVRKAAEVLGLGHDAVVAVRTDQCKQMELSDLRRRLCELEEQGLQAMAVVATAGTTDFGSVDPLAEIADVVREHRTWLHVDAAYGGGLVTSARRRQLLDGIERADSVTIDFHKSFFQTVASSAVLVRDRAELAHVTFHADYLNPRDADPDARPNQVDKSLQTTRRFDALKLWCTLRMLGADRIGEHLDTVIDLADEAWLLLTELPDFEVAVRPTLSTVVFRYAPPGTDEADLDHLNAAAREALFASGEAVVAGTKIAGRTWLKLTLLNPTTTMQDLRAVVDLLRSHARATQRVGG